MKKEIWESPKEARELNEAETPLWFWNDKLETEELLRQLKMQTEIGVTCTNPHARTNGGEGFIGGYLDEEWFSHMNTVLSYKIENQEPMWLYDEIDWPAGTCNRTITQEERYREQYITIEEIKIPAGEKYRAQLQTFEGKGVFGIQDKEELLNQAVNIVLVNAQTGDKIDLSEYLIFDMFGPELEYCSEVETIAYLTKINVDAYVYGGDEQVNYLDADATKAFLTSTYEKYNSHMGKKFGTTITTVFNDETRMCHPIAWSKDFAKKFIEKNGYDIRKEIYQLIRTGEKAGRIRVAYFDMLAELYQKNYFKVIQDWCHGHDLKLFAHLLAEETLFGHARYSGDYMRQNRYQDICGVDHLGKGIGSLNAKFTACAAHSYGKKRTAVEVFAGCGWDMTFEEYIRIVTWMYQQGMQIIINHGFFYSDRGKRKNDWPPSQFFQWDGYEHMSEGNDMIRRLHYALTDGVNESDILVYHPIESFWLHYQPDQHYTHAFFHGAFLKDSKAVEIDQEMQLLYNTLSSHNLDFDMIHKDAIENFEIKQGKICNKESKQMFSTLVLPECEVLPLQMAQLCKEFVQNGGKLIITGALPRFGMNCQEDAEVQNIFNELRRKVFYQEKMDRKEIIAEIKKCSYQPIKIVKGTLRTENNHPAYASYLIDPYMHGGEDLTGVMFVKYLKDGKRNTLFMNYGNEPEKIEVFVMTTGGVPEIWNTHTGEIQQADVKEKAENGYYIIINLPCNYGVLLVSELE